MKGPNLNVGYAYEETILTNIILSSHKIVFYFITRIIVRAR